MSNLVPIGSVRASETNVRGESGSKEAFQDLVRSVKEQGILVSLIVRPVQGAAGKYELVAGHRRLAAAKAAKLDQVPVDIRNLSDAQAKEVQIVENLQREDVHPLEEAAAYRELLDKAKYEVASIAAKVGKSEAYVRQRLFLTNLEAPVARAYRSGKILDGHAVQIARLSPGDQASALTFMTRSTYHTPSVNDLKRHIQETFNSPLERQPWLKDVGALKAVGPCKECPPNVPSLFGNVPAGRCTDKTCWRRKMNRYVAYLKEQKPNLVLISKEYRYSGDGEDTKGILSEGHYAKPGPKDKCQYSEMALVAQGRDTGSMIRVCVSKECKKHGKQSQRGGVSLSPEEKAKIAKKKAAEEAREKKSAEKRQAEIAAGLKKVRWPVNRKTVNVLATLAVKSDMADDEDMEEIAKRRGIEGTKRKGSSYVDWEEVFSAAVPKLSDQDAAQLLVELMIASIYGQEEKRRVLKMLD